MNNSTRCSTCNNNGSYLVAQYVTHPNGSNKQNGWKKYECKNCKIMVESVHLLHVIENRINLITDPNVKNELEKLLECVPSRNLKFSEEN